MRRTVFLETLFALITLVWVVILTFLLLFVRPYSGFSYLANSGIVTRVIQPGQAEQSLRPGDKILAINGEHFKSAPSGWSFDPLPFASYQPGELIPLTVERAGRRIEVTHPFLGPNSQEFMERLNSQWLIPIFFWLAGATTLLFIRPRTTVSRLMEAFFFLTAFWIAAGTASAMQLDWTAMAMRVAIWLTIPIYWHFFWHFPASLGKLPKPVLWGIYGLGSALALLQTAVLLPLNTYAIGFTVALLGSLVLILAHFIRQGEKRKQLAGLLVAAVIVIVPTALLSFLYSQAAGYLGVAAVIGFSALPGYFFLTLLRRQLALPDRQVNRITRLYIAAIFLELLVAILPLVLVPQAFVAGLSGVKIFSSFLILLTSLIGFTPFLVLPALARAEILLPNPGERPVVIRANRLAADVTGFILAFFLFLALFELARSAVPPLWQGLLAAALALALVVLALQARPAFQAWFQLKLLGMPLQPDKLSVQFSSRILNSLEEAGLRNLLLEQVLPSLLVRQALLLRRRPDGQLAPFLASRLSPAQAAQAQTAAFSASGAQLLPPSAPGAPLDWARVTVPLHLGGEAVGVWYFGARDPDDYYDSRDLELLEQLAAQVALALAHIDQANRLRAIYLDDVSRSDAERLEFARELHDAVLNSLALARNSPYMTQAPAQLDELMGETIQHVRRVVKGLRPEMLNYGLFAGLQALVDDLSDTLPQGCPEISISVTNNAIRLDPKVELNLFRVAQQACQNAIRHAEAKSIRITGKIESNSVDLSVEDNGKGFDFQGETDLAGLLSHQHYGLAGMHERAAVIDATLLINSIPGQGTLVQVDWKKSQFMT